MESQYFLISDIDREDLILLGREFQSLMEEGKKLMSLNKRMYDRKDGMIKLCRDWFRRGLA